MKITKRNTNHTQPTQHAHPNTSRTPQHNMFLALTLSGFSKDAGTPRLACKHCPCTQPHRVRMGAGGGACVCVCERVRACMCMRVSECVLRYVSVCVRECVYAIMCVCARAGLIGECGSWTSTCIRALGITKPKQKNDNNGNKNQ